VGGARLHDSCEDAADAWTRRRGSFPYHGCCCKFHDAEEGFHVDRNFKCCAKCCSYCLGRLEIFTDLLKESLKDNVCVRDERAELLLLTLCHRRGCRRLRRLESHDDFTRVSSLYMPLVLLQRSRILSQIIPPLISIPRTLKQREQPDPYPTNMQSRKSFSFLKPVPGGCIVRSSRLCRLSDRRYDAPHELPVWLPTSAEVGCFLALKFSSSCALK
jgi:hypothetical protein